jgi:hypothetical protein
LRGFAQGGEFTNLLLKGPAGVGKTTVAAILCEAVNADVLRINASMDRGIGIVRERIVDFASTFSFSGGRKVVLLEEADSLTDEAQLALRDPIETHAANCAFIFTCNYPEKIIPPLHSRCAALDFAPHPEEVREWREQYYRRMCKILEQERVEYDPRAIAEIVDENFPDLRRILNEVQGYAVYRSGAIRAPAPEIIRIGEAGPARDVSVNGADSKASVPPEPQPGPPPAGALAEPPRPLTRELPLPDPFPVEALGTVLAPAAHAIHDRVRAPLAICGQSVLAAATLAVQGHANVVLPMGHAKPLSGFFVTVAATGERKSAVDQEALRPVRRREAALNEAYPRELFEYENNRIGWALLRKAAIKDAGNNLAAAMATLIAAGPKPLPPLQPLLTCADPTFEGLCLLLPDSLPSIGIFAAEGGQFVGGYGMADAKKRTAAGLSAVWDGEPIRRVRTREGVTVLAGRRVAMHMMVQPDVAAIWIGDRFLIEQGFMSRVLVTAPEAASGTRVWKEPSGKSDAATNPYNARLLGILTRPLPLAAGTRNELAPRALPLSRQARRHWIGFYNDVEKRLVAGGELEPVRGLANKLPEHAARIAAVLTLVNDIEAGEVGPAEMEAGIAVAQHYAGEALRLFGGSRMSDDLREAQQLLGWLHTSWPQPEVSLPDIYQRGPNSIRDMRRARRVVGILEDHGHLVRVPDGVSLTAPSAARCGRSCEDEDMWLGFTMVDLRAFLEGGSEGGGC